MKRDYLAMITLPVVLLVGCGDATSEATGPKADYPFVAPELEENPPMTPNDIDRIDGEVSKQSTRK